MRNYLLFPVFRTAALAVAIASTAALHAQSGAPPEYQDLYVELDSILSDFQPDRQRSAATSTVSPHFGGTSKLATSNRNEYLLAPYLPLAVRIELDRLKELGVTAIVVDINFPILYGPYHNDPVVRQKYLNFYRFVASEVRARGLKLIVSSWVNVATPEIQKFYNTLSFGQYAFGRMDVARTIAKELKPDYLLLGSEPDVESMMTGQPTDNPVYSVGLINAILSNLEKAGVRTMPVGAGIGTWQASYMDFVEAYCATSLDYIDFHIYPIGLDFLPRINEIVETAKSHGKGVSASESWLYKVRESELGGSIGSLAFQRDLYSFWAPLNNQFIEMLVDVSRTHGLLFSAPFFTDYFYDYVNYDEAQQKNLTFEQQLSQHTTNWVTNLSAGKLTETGQAYKNAIAGQ